MNPYKKLSHFNDMLKMSYEPNKINPYTDKQFEEDLKKWFSETIHKPATKPAANEDLPFYGPERPPTKQSPTKQSPAKKKN